MNIIKEKNIIINALFSQAVDTQHYVDIVLCTPNEKPTIVLRERKIETLADYEDAKQEWLNVSSSYQLRPNWTMAFRAMEISDDGRKINSLKNSVIDFKS